MKKRPDKFIRVWAETHDKVVEKANKRGRKINKHLDDLANLSVTLVDRNK